MHVLWDWNGTLLDDTHACVGALNAMLKRRGRSPITLEFFKDHFAFPARQFYDSLGMEVPDSEWAALAREYYAEYQAIPAALSPDAIPALELVRAAGHSQSLVSALRQDLLEECAERFGIRRYFEHLVGSDNLDGGSKLEGARRLYAQLGRPSAVIIGDSLHEREIADDLGIRCVLHGCGSHAHARLAAVAPTAESVLAAARMALGVAF